ncbi:IMP cyclohydrolase [Natronobiforma cellulositropha]|uniref:IMP cyclohydrolase n=1 Tax=Natronobiforma cellulositropha TaxID=1679076 RepID=UPI0021D5837F|nr:IMP cyclohydrolase [Natronobiforma cellulositropha]
MYIGRFLVVSPDGGAYRVSSRSFPNRAVTTRDEGRTLTVGPTAAAEETDNPYVAYNCLRVVDTPTGETVAFGNGSHVDPISEKLELGYPARDALASSLLALDYEKDAYDTPRIAATLDADGTALIGTVRADAILVETVDEPTLVATYERDTPEAFAFDLGDAAGTATDALGLEFDHAVCAAAVSRTDDGFDLAVDNGDD